MMIASILTDSSTFMTLCPSNGAWAGLGAAGVRRALVGLIRIEAWAIIKYIYGNEVHLASINAAQ